MNRETIHQLMRRHPRKGSRYEPVVREAVAQYATRRRREGAMWRDLVAETGVSDKTIRQWVAWSNDGFTEVVVVDEPEPVEVNRGLTLTSPAGFALTGLDLDEAIAALEVLG